MIAALLALTVFLAGVPRPLPLDPVGIAVWYGARCPKGVTNYGRADTCSPYAGGGELVMYAATGEVYNYPRGYKPPRVTVCRRDTIKCVEVVIRDSCRGCRADGKGGRIIDLSPAAFIRLAPLDRGVIYVTVRP